VGRAAVQYLQEIGARPVAGVRPERLEEARRVAGEALDITATPAEATFDFAISTAAAVALNLIRHVRDGGQVASIVPVPDDANPGDRVRVQALYHRTDGAMLHDVALAAAKGALVIPIAQTFPLAQVGAAQAAVAAGAPGKVVLKH
jgi:NADPH:quinone reductase-like Zn-dependent oxidoreductase